MGARVVPAQVRVEEMTVPVLAGEKRLPSLSVSASTRGDRMTVTLTNPSVDTARTVRLRVAGSRQPTEARATVLTHAVMNAANTFAQPEAGET